MRRLRYLRAGARALRAASAVVAASSVSLAGLVVILVAGLAAAGCGPAQFLRQVNGRAAAAVAAAKDAHADRLAPYEYTAATEYLLKAREEGAYAQYQVAIEYGRRAEELAGQARVRSQSAGVEAAAAEDAAAAGAGAGVDGPVTEPPAPVKDTP